jgi:hypothetical protein
VTGQDDGRSSFVRGMTIGAIIGAIVAGSSLWSRRRRRQHEDPESGSEAGLVGSPDESLEPLAPSEEPPLSR